MCNFATCQKDCKVDAAIKSTNVEKHFTHKVILTRTFITGFQSMYFGLLATIKH